ncbi:MAG: molybdate ABC transporter permease subunit, partial [Thiotrichaceae bacterium]|nr:molybdate ABC transporter permease subunit [Thiotrichaceae bacterium]
MDWQALALSVKLSLVTLLFLLPIGILFGRWLAYRQFWGKSLFQTILALPLVLPPTVLGYYLLVLFSPN